MHSRLQRAWDLLRARPPLVTLAWVLLVAWALGILVAGVQLDGWRKDLTRTLMQLNADKIGDPKKLLPETCLRIPQAPNQLLNLASAPQRGPDPPPAVDPRIATRSAEVAAAWQAAAREIGRSGSHAVPVRQAMLAMEKAISDLEIGKPQDQAVALKIFEGVSFILTPLPTLAVMLFAIGILSILMGLLAEMLNRTYHESQSKPVYRIGRIVQAARIREGN